MLTKTIHDKFFGATLYFALGPVKGIRELLATPDYLRFQRILNNGIFSYASAFTIRSADNLDSSYLIWLNKADMGKLSHEVNHLVNTGLTRLGFELTNPINDQVMEIYGRYQGFWIKEIYQTKGIKWT